MVAEKGRNIFIFSDYNDEETIFKTYFFTFTYREYLFVDTLEKIFIAIYTKLLLIFPEFV